MIDVTAINRPTILIIDDDEQIRRLLESLLRDDHDCVVSQSAEEAIEVLKTNRFDLVISDINMGGISGLDLVPFVLREAPDTVVVMISGLQTIDTAIGAMRAGAFDYIMKPLDISHVEAAVSRALAHSRLLAQKRIYENHLEELVAQRAAEIERLEYFDSLTELPNRVLFEDRLSQALKHAQIDNHQVGLLLLSVDRFKQLHDTLGHQAGGRLLREIGERVRRSVNEQGTVARFESGEFAYLSGDIRGPEDMLELAHAISASFKSRFTIDEHELYITASMGICLSQTCQTVQDILKHAAIALNRAQSMGGNCHQFYLEDMLSSAFERLTLETEFRNAVENGELELHYQPQVDLNDNRIIGVEALVRWSHPRRGLLPPSEFIPMAEETGLILPMGEWVLKTACGQLAAWNQSGLDNLRMAVNVAPQQFQRQDFREVVAGALSVTGIDPESLALEITEGSVMQKGPEVIELLSDLKRMGVRISIDDFGMGYSSLAYLKRLPIDELKIDRTFVKDAISDPDDAALVVAIITLAHNLRLEVMAEGVETGEHLRFLRLLKCDGGQGFFFSKPLSADSFFSLAIAGGRIDNTVTTAKQ